MSRSISSRRLHALRENIVQIRTAECSGSGVVLARIAETTILVTSYHLLSSDPSSPFDIVVKKPSGEAVIGEGTDIQWFDRKNDFLIVVTDFPKGTLRSRGIGFAPAKSPSVGDEVFAIGNPGDLHQVVSRGIVSDLLIDGGVPYVLHDAHINPGNSGGALVSTSGRMLGMVTAKVGEDTEGLNLAVMYDYIIHRATPLLESVWGRKKADRGRPLEFDSDLKLPTGVMPDHLFLDLLREQVQVASGVDLFRSYQIVDYQRDLATRTQTEQVTCVFQHAQMKDHLAVQVSGGHYVRIAQLDGKAQRKRKG